MTATPSEKSVSPRSATAAPATAVASVLESAQGKTSIADSVVSKIAGMAARDVAGVHSLGGTASRAVGAIRERIPGATQNVSQGVTVEVGEVQAAVDLQMIVEYGVSIPDLADSVRRNVIGSVERMTGLQVTEVNVTVNDVYLPQDDAAPAAPEQPRVQ